MMVGWRPSVPERRNMRTATDHGALYPGRPAILLRSGRRLYCVRSELLRGHDQHHAQPQLFLDWHHPRPSARDSKVYMRNDQIEYGGMTWKTFPERLQEAGIRWKSYQNELTRSELTGEEEEWLANYGDNVLECFSAYNVEAYPGFIPAGKRWISELSAHAAKLETQLAAERRSRSCGCASCSTGRNTRPNRKAQGESIANGGEARYSQLSAQQKALHHAAFVTNADDPITTRSTSLSFEDEGKSQTMNVPEGRHCFISSAKT